MAIDEFCGVEFYTDEWSPKIPVRQHWHARPMDKFGRPHWDAIDRMIEEMWQKPSGRIDCTVIEKDQPLAERFREQADKWNRETAHLSSPTQRIMHPSYQAILGMARDDPSEIIRLLLRDLQQHRREWFWALSYLTKENPIDRKDAGNMDKMIKAWVDWGNRRGLL